MTSPALTNQSPTAVSVDTTPRVDTSDTDVAQALVRKANEAVRWALTPPVEMEANRTVRQDAPTETPTRRLTDRAGNLSRAAPVFGLPPQPSSHPRRATLHALQEWEGYVIEINGDELLARLVDLTVGSTHEEEEATIPLAEIAEGDAAAMRVGSIFRWVIGYERSPAGTKKRVSQIVFRDLPRMTERDFQEGRNWARETMRAFDR